MEFFFLIIHQGTFKRIIVIGVERCKRTARWLRIHRVSNIRTGREQRIPECNFNPLIETFFVYLFSYPRRRNEAEFVLSLLRAY